MRGVMRVVACLAVALFAIGLVKQRSWISTSPRDVRQVSEPVSPGEVRQVSEPVSPGEVRQVSEPVSPGEVRQVSEPVNPANPKRDADADTAPASPYRSSFVRALGGMIDQSSEVLGGTDGELQETLARPDAILTDSRNSSREALRQANRQVRLPGRSPHLLLFLVDGLQGRDLNCYGSVDRSTPACDRLARQGIRATGFTLNPTGANSNLYSLLSGSQIPAASASEPAGARLRFAEMLWRSGYSPALLGNRFATGWRADQPGGWELCFGWLDAPGNAASDWSPFPSQVSSGGKIMRVAKRDASEPVSFSQILHDESISFVRSQKARRPVALVVITPLDWWRALADPSSVKLHAESSAAERSRAAAVARFDEFLGRLVESLDAEVGQNQLAVLLAGISNVPAAEEPGSLNESSAERRETSPSPSRLPDAAPLLARWPNHLPAGLVVESPVHSTDLLPTVADLIQSTRKSRSGSGRSQWAAWRKP